MKIHEITNRAENLIEQGEIAKRKRISCQEMVNTARRRVINAYSNLDSAMSTVDENGNCIGNVTAARNEVRAAEMMLRSAKSKLFEIEKKIEIIKSEKIKTIRNIEKYEIVEEKNKHKLEELQKKRFGSNINEFMADLVSRMNSGEQARVQLLKSMGIFAQAKTYSPTIAISDLKLEQLSYKKNGDESEISYMYAYNNQSVRYNGLRRNKFISCSLASKNSAISKEPNSLELNLINEYTNNDVFRKSVSFNSGEGGTGITYKVFQRNDIDWDMIRIKGARRGRGLTNAEAAARYGLAPILDVDGNIATLHHSQQNSRGPLFEASTKYHNISTAQTAPLHPYKRQLNPFNPMSGDIRKTFQKVDSIEYWKARGRDAMKGAK